VSEWADVTLALTDILDDIDAEARSAIYEEAAALRREALDKECTLVAELEEGIYVTEEMLREAGVEAEFVTGNSLSWEATLREVDTSWLANVYLSECGVGFLKDPSRALSPEDWRTFYKRVWSEAHPYDDFDMMERAVEVARRRKGAL